AGHPHERGRRHRLVLRVGAGPRSALLGPRRDSRQARREAERRLRPRLGDLRRTDDPVANGRARRRHPRGCLRTRGARALSVVDRVRDAMVATPRTLEASESAQAAGEALARPEVRAVLVTRDGRLVGVVTRKTLVRAVVAAGSDPTTTQLGPIAEEPYLTVDADLPLDEGFRLLEERDLERVPVLEADGQLVGILSRGVIQRRLAEDEELEGVEDPA